MADGKIAVEMTADEAKLFKELARSENAVRALKDRVKELERGFTNAGTAGVAAFDKAKTAQSTLTTDGPKALQGIKDYAAGLLSVATAAGVAKAALQALNEERNRGAEGLKAAQAPTAMLAQLAGGDAGKLKQLKGEVAKSRAEQGFSVDEAAKLQFTLESMGMGDQRGMFAGLRQVFEDPAKFAESVGTWQNAFGTAEAGDPRAIANKLMTAGGFSKTKSDVFAQAMAAPAGLAGQVGASDEEVAAIGAVLSRGAKSAEVGATQLRALEQVLMQKGITSGGIMGGVSAITQELERLKAQGGLSEDERAERAKNLGILQDPSSVLSAAERYELQQNAGRAAAAREKLAGGGRLSSAELSAMEQSDSARERVQRAREAAQKREAEFARKQADGSNVGKLATEYFGSVEAFSAFSNIKLHAGEIQSVQREIEKAGRMGPGQDAVSRAQGLVESDPNLRAVRELDRANQRRLLEEEERFGRGKVKSDATADLLAWQDMRDNASAPVRLVNRAMDRAVDTLSPLGLDERTMRGTRRLPAPAEWAAEGISAATNAVSGLFGGGGERGAGEAVKKLSDAADKLASAAEKMNGGRRPALKAVNDDDKGKK